MTDPHEATGNPRVDAALAELDRIAPLPPEHQVAGFASVQQELQATLSTIDQAEPAPHSSAMQAIANARPGR
jgi:hypothetical protein